MLLEYQPPIMHMLTSQLTCDVAKACITALLNVLIMLGFHYPMLLELFHGFIKMVQARDIYVVDFVEAMKLVQVDICCYYSAIEIAFKDDAFVVFNNVINFQSDVLPLVWAMNLTCPKLDVLWCALRVGTKLAWLHVDDLQIGEWNQFFLVH